MYYDEAAELANLHISDVGKTYLLLKYSNLPDKLISDIKLKVNGDLSQFDQIRGLLNRLAQQGTAYRQSTPALMHYGEHETDDHDEHTHESYYQDDPEHSYQDDDGEWYVWDEGVSDEYDEDHTEEPSETYWKGGRGRGSYRRSFTPRYGKGKSKRPRNFFQTTEILWTR